MTPTSNPAGPTTAALQVECLTVGPLGENCYLLSDPAAGVAVLVDPGDEPERLLQAVTATGCALQAIWLTHAHFDHLGAVAAILRACPVPVHMHPLDAPLYAMASTSAARWGITIEAPPGPTQPLAEGGTIVCGGHAFQIWHLPGHAPGHVAFLGETLCISGDLLFAGSIGRTDLPLCDPQAMHHSLGRLATLPPHLQVLCGHGPITTIGRELDTNPFLRGLARPIGA